MYQWLIPDCYLPGGGDDDLPGHEAICILNHTTQDVELLIDVYFTDQDPIRDVKMVVPAERSAHWGIGGPYRLEAVDIPENTPFSLRVRSEVPVGIQYTRVLAKPGQLGLMTVFVPPTVEQ